MSTPKTWRFVYKKWFQIASGVFMIDLSAIAFIRALYPDMNPFLYLFGILFVPGLLAIVGAIVGLIANSRVPDN